MSRHNTSEIIITEQARTDAYQLIKLFRGINVSRLGPPDHRKRNPTQDAYVDSLIDQTNGTLFQLFSLAIAVANETEARNQSLPNKYDQQSIMILALRDIFRADITYITKDDYKRLSRLDQWVNAATIGTKDDGVNHLGSGLAGASLTSIILLFCVIKTNQMHVLLSDLIDVFGHLGDDITPLKNVKKELGDEEDIRLPLDEEGQKALLKKHLVASPTNFDNLIIRADLRLKELLHAHKKAQSNQALEMDLLDKNNPNLGSASFDRLSKLADKLVEDAERRESHFNDERVLAAQIRLTINQQRVKPLKPNEFTKKITPLLKQAENNFGRRRHYIGWNIIKDILKILTVYNLPKEYERYKKTGTCRLFSEESDALRTVRKITAEARTVLAH